MLSVKDDCISLTAAERASGRENFDFFCFMLWPFIESYWLAAVGILAIDWSNVNGGGLSEKDLVVHVQKFGRTLYHEGHLDFVNLLTTKTQEKENRRLGLL